jgi:hypothetical protein
LQEKNGEWNKARIANEVADAILDDIEISGADSSSLATALAATKKFKLQFESGTVGKILGYSKNSTPQIDPSLTLDISVGRGGPKGALDLDNMMVTPEAKIATQKYMARSFTDYAINKKTGDLDPIKVQKWISANEEILDKFPGFAQKLSDAGEAQKIANQTKIVMQVRKATLRDPKISASAEYLNAADMNRVASSVLKSKNPVIAARELSRKALKDPTGKAINGVRGVFVDELLEKSRFGSSNEFGEPMPNGKAFLEYINKNTKALDEIFTKDQMVRMRMVGRELSQIESLQKMTAGKTEVEMKDVASTFLKMMFRIGGAQIGRWVASITGGGTVQTPGIMSERFQLFAKYLTKDRAFELVHDAILDPEPELLKTLLAPIEKPTIAKNETFKIVDQRINAWLAGSGQRVMNDILREEKENKDAE